MSWGYICSSIKPESSPIQPKFYSLSELCEQYDITGAVKEISPGFITYNGHGMCSIKTLDGMCGVMIVYGMQLDYNDVPAWVPLLDFLAQKGRYTYITLSHIVGTSVLAAWKQHGYKALLAFNNKRTYNNVELLFKEVEYATK